MNSEEHTNNSFPIQHGREILDPYLWFLIILEESNVFLLQTTKARVMKKTFSPKTRSVLPSSQVASPPQPSPQGCDPHIPTLNHKSHTMSPLMPDSHISFTSLSTSYR